MQRVGGRSSTAAHGISVLRHRPSCSSPAASGPTMRCTSRATRRGLWSWRLSALDPSIGSWALERVMELTLCAGSGGRPGARTTEVGHVDPSRSRSPQRGKAQPQLMPKPSAAAGPPPPKKGTSPAALSYGLRPRSRSPAPKQSWRGGAAPLSLPPPPPKPPLLTTVDPPLPLCDPSKNDHNPPIGETLPRARPPISCDDDPCPICPSLPGEDQPPPPPPDQSSDIGFPPSE